MSEYTDRTCGIGLPEDKKKSLVPKDKINLTIGVFFDGTLNNKYNIDYARKTGKEIDDSYKGSYSNVVELYECYDKDLTNVKKIYIEGIGSAEPKEDGTSSEKTGYTRGYAWGTGSSGVNAKVQRGCELIAEEVKKTLKNSSEGPIIINTLTLDVFGFSRGAAAARSFASQIEGILGTKTEGKKVSLRGHISKEDVPSIKVRFLGIFDTVSSFSPGVFTLSAFENDVPELSLRIPSNVGKTVHLVAADEYREYFSLTTTESAGAKKVEVVLPGAHSDVGGGYAASESEEIIMYYDRLDRPQTGENDCRGYMSLEKLYEEQWIPADWDIKKDLLDRTGIFSKRIPGRYVKNDYAKIPLAMMGAYTNKEHQCFSKKLDEKSKIEARLEQLVTMKTRIMSIVDGGPLLYRIYTGRIAFIGSDDDLSKIRSIRAEYQHLSARNKTGHNAQKNNERLIIPG